MYITAVMHVLSQDMVSWLGEVHIWSLRNQTSVAGRLTELLIMWSLLLINRESSALCSTVGPL